MKNIRLYQSTDEAAVAAVWHRSGQKVYTFLPLFQKLTLEKAVQVFHEIILTHGQVWVGEEDGHICAFLGLKDSYISWLYVDPADQGQGWGSALLELAKRLHPHGLELHTHVENYPARRFYEKHGFVAVKFGISPAPELAPDVEYHWRPASSTSPE